MTVLARARRDFRHKNEPAIMTAYSRTGAGKRSTVGQVKAAARAMLRDHTAKLVLEKQAA